MPISGRSTTRVRAVSPIRSIIRSGATHPRPTRGEESTMSHAQSTAAVQPELQPPEAFTLEPPPPVAPVPPASASGRVRLDPEEVSRLDAQVREFIDQIAD